MAWGERHKEQQDHKIIKKERSSEALKYLR